MEPLVTWGFPCGSAGRVRLQCGRPGFDPRVGKIPWRGERLSTSVFWPGEFHGLCSLWGCRELDTTEHFHFHFQASLVAQRLKHLPAMQETWVRSQGREYPLEKKMATHSSQCSCLENPIDRGAWWATGHGVAKSRTRLSDLTYLSIR